MRKEEVSGMERVEYRRSDGELLGWIQESGDADGYRGYEDADEWVPVDLLGRTGPAGDWFAAESYLEERGLAYLAELYAFEASLEHWVRVRIVEVNAHRVRVKEDDFGDVNASTPVYELEVPVGGRLVEYEKSILHG